MPEVEYDRPLSEDVRKRHYHKTERGQVVDFVVQLEVKVEQTWKPVIRYDCAHGFAHKDCYNLREERKKERLELNYKEALILADSDTNDNWETYRRRFLEEEYP